MLPRLPLLVVATIGLSTISGVTAHAASDGTWEQLGSTIVGPSQDSEQKPAAINANGNVVVLGARYHSDGGNFAVGMTRVFEWTGSTWQQRGQSLIGSIPGDQVGASVALDASGEIMATNIAEDVVVYRYSNGTWSQAGNRVSIGVNRVPEIDLDASGTRLVVSDWSTTVNGRLESGTVRIYDYSVVPGQWTQIGGDINGEFAHEEFGNSVAISGDGSRIIVGTPYFDDNGSDRGRAKIFAWDGTTWNLEASYTGLPFEYAAKSVDLNHDGSVASIGLWNWNNGAGQVPGPGGVAIGRRSGAQWTIGRVMQGDVNGRFMGASVALSGDGARLAVASSGGRGVAKEAQVFEWDGIAWTRLGEMLPDWSAINISADGRTIGLFEVGAFNGVLAIGFAEIRRFVPDPVVAPPVTPIFRVTLDANGGTCTRPTSLVVVAFGYLPGSSDCSRPGFTFSGWANQGAPGTIRSFPVLVDPSDGQRRYFVTEDVDLIAIWTKLPEAVSDLAVLANFLCGPCTNAWLLFATPSDATGFEVAVDGTATTCAQTGTYLGLSLCEITGLASGPTNFSVTPLRGTERGPATSTVVTLRR